MTLSVLAWLRGVFGSSRLSGGDAVQLSLGPDDPRSAQYDGAQGIVDEVVHTHRGQTLYAVNLDDSGETVYVEDHKVEAL